MLGGVILREAQNYTPLNSNIKNRMIYTESGVGGCRNNSRNLKLEGMDTFLGGVNMCEV